MSDAGMGFVHNSQALCPSQRAQPTWGCLGHLLAHFVFAFGRNVPVLVLSCAQQGSQCSQAAPCSVGHSKHWGRTAPLCMALTWGPSTAPSPRMLPALCPVPPASLRSCTVVSKLPCAFSLLPSHTRMQQRCSHDKASSSELLMYTRKHIFNIQHLDRQ